MIADILAVVDDGFNWERIFGTSLGIATSAGLVLALGRIAIWSQWQLVKHESERNKTLEERIDEQEARQSQFRIDAMKREDDLRDMYDQSMVAHRHCEHELNQHKIVSAREVASLHAEVADLRRILERPMRSTDSRDQLGS